MTFAQRQSQRVSFGVNALILQWLCFWVWRELHVVPVWLSHVIGMGGGSALGMWLSWWMIERRGRTNDT